MDSLVFCDKAVAMGWFGFCCWRCKEPEVPFDGFCDNCLNNEIPERWQVTIPALANGVTPCTQCATLAGTYVLNSFPAGQGIFSCFAETGCFPVNIPCTGFTITEANIWLEVSGAFKNVTVALALFQSGLCDSIANQPGGTIYRWQWTNPSPGSLVDCANFNAPTIPYLSGGNLICNAAGTTAGAVAL